MQSDSSATMHRVFSLFPALAFARKDNHLIPSASKLESSLLCHQSKDRELESSTFRNLVSRSVSWNEAVFTAANLREEHTRNLCVNNNFRLEFSALTGEFNKARLACEAVALLNQGVSDEALKSHFAVLKDLGIERPITLRKARTYTTAETNTNAQITSGSPFKPSGSRYRKKKKRRILKQVLKKIKDVHNFPDLQGIRESILDLSRPKKRLQLSIFDSMSGSHSDHERKLEDYTPTNKQRETQPHKLFHNFDFGEAQKAFHQVEEHSAVSEFSLKAL